MQLDANQIQGKPRRIGTRDGDKPVLALVTKGGFNMIVSPRGGQFETLGTGPHACVARHIAEKHDKSIVWNELAKSEWLDPTHYEWLVPRYEAITDKFRSLQGF